MRMALRRLNSGHPRAHLLLLGWREAQPDAFVSSGYAYGLLGAHPAGGVARGCAYYVLVGATSNRNGMRRRLLLGPGWRDQIPP